MYIIKRVAELNAYRLGAGTDTERQLLASGKLQKLPDGNYLVFSRETDVQGQLARPGDSIKVDSAGFPYPSFEASHTHLGSTRYRQEAPVLKAWTVREPTCPEIAFLLAQGKLRIDEGDTAHYFRARLWDAKLFAAKDAVIVFDRVRRSAGGAVEDVRFHTISKTLCGGFRRAFGFYSPATRASIRVRA